MAISRFEDIQAWQAARALATIVYDLSGTVGFSRDFALRDQARRAAVSMMANVAEGFDPVRMANAFNFCIMPFDQLLNFKVISM